ncbi:hypothetical protein FHETE_7055 [Fusarium heterosporum]|uniref:Uncharacterized protein n=1 Tax=Fusarium heterosporum TaxID=42747 RepID=A0A8H5T2H8_FUSHE|nr:hypothetical protein FHETE_7055 [Fusarium heterosporum]
MRSTLFALATLPFYILTQGMPTYDVPIPTTDATFTAPILQGLTNTTVNGHDTTTSDMVPEVAETSTKLPVPDTTTQQPVIQETTTQQPPIQDTATQLPVIPNTTTEKPFVQDTTQLPPPIQDVTTELPPRVVNTTAGVAPIDTTTQPIKETLGPETTTKEIIPQGTTTDIPVVHNNTTDVPVIQKPTTDLPHAPETTTVDAAVGQHTTTDIPGIPNNTTDLPVVQDTTTKIPVITDTTTNLPTVQNTTSDIPVVHDTTTDLPPASETTTTAQQPAETTTQHETSQSTTKEENKEPASTTEKGKDVPVITQAPEPTAAPSEATSNVSSVSSQVAALIPIINQWTNEPDSRKDETSKKVEKTRDDVIGVIVALGGKPDVGCSTKKRGLLGPIGDIINKLACTAKDLTSVSSNIIIGNVPAVTGAITGVQVNINNLTGSENLNKDKDGDKDKDTKQKEESSKQEETSKATTESPSTTSEATTTTEASTTTSARRACRSGICGACQKGRGPLDAEMNTIANYHSDCGAIPTITTDIPSTPGGNFGGFSVTEPTAQPKPPPIKPALQPRFDDDTSPNAHYVGNLRPQWVSQEGDVSGQWFGFPRSGYGAAGVNGLFGCSAVIIVSNRGVYISHIWEDPIFIDEDFNPRSKEDFRRNGFKVLRDGNEDARSITSLLGTRSNPGPLNAIYSPKVFVLTPFTNPEDTDIIKTKYVYEPQAKMLAADLARTIPGSGDQGYLIGYTVTSEEESTAQHGYAGRAIVEVDMMDRVVDGPRHPDNIYGMNIARWRLWVEDTLVTSQEFWADGRGPGSRKREDDPDQKCLIIGHSTATSAGPTSNITTVAETVETAKTEETTAAEWTTHANETTKAEQTTEAQNATQIHETTTQETTLRETSKAGETTEAQATSAVEGTITKPPTTLQTSFITTTSAPDTTTGDTYTGPYYCVNNGGPHVATPHCQCSTTSDGHEFYTTVSLIDGHCDSYHSYPGPVSMAPTEVPSPAQPTPFTTTLDRGLILAYPDQTMEVGNYPGGSYTYTKGFGVASTVRPADPVRTDGDAKGSILCGTIRDACLRAASNFGEKVIYTEFASYFSVIEDNALTFFTLGTAGCEVEYDCSDWSKGALTGKQIYDAYESMTKLGYFDDCGTAYLDNTCRVTANYCLNCNERHQKIV